MSRIYRLAAALPMLCLLAAAAFDEGPPKPTGPEAGGAQATTKPGNAHLLNLRIPSKARVMVVPVNDEESTRWGMIDPWQAGFVGRRLREAGREKYDLVILEIETNGGYIFACDKINRQIAECGVPVVAFVRGKAFSGGALISVGCAAIAMEPGSQIGGAQAVGLFGDLDHDERNKAKEWLVTGVAALCEKNQYPQAIVRGMVDSEVEVFETDDPQHRFVTKTELDNWSAQAGRAVPNVIAKLKKSDEILSLTSQQAFDMGLSSGIYKDRDALLAGMSVQPSELNMNSITPSEKIARFLGHPAWLVLLVVVGLIGLVWELKSPGHGVGYGIFGLCLCLFFWLAIFADTAGAAELILFGLGALLLGLEFFVLPGFGVAGFAGISLILVSIMLAFLPEGSIPSFFKRPGETSPFQAELIQESLMWATLALFTVIAAITAALVAGVRLPGIGRMALKAEVVSTTSDAQTAQLESDRTKPGYTPAYPDTSKSTTPVAQTEAAAHPKLAELIGKEGLAESVLRPAGKVRLDGVSYDAATEGEWIDAGHKVRVLGVHGPSLLVRGV